MTTSTALVSPSWDRCLTFLKQNQPSTVKWLPLLRNGCIDWTASQRVMDADTGVISDATSVAIRIEMLPMDIDTFTAEEWQKRLRQLKHKYPALGIVGMKGARKLMLATPGVPVQFDSAAGFVSSIGVNIDAYKKAEAAGWNPADNIKVPRGKRKGGPGADEPMGGVPTEPIHLLMPPTSLAIANAVPIGMPTPMTLSTLQPVSQPVTYRAPQKPHEAPNRRDPPSEVHKLLRTAARCSPLIKYLKKEQKFAYMNESQWRCIRKWCETADGMAWLKDAGLDPLSYHLHHVKAKEVGGHYSIYNCVFAPGSANGWWGTTDSAHMREYIGDEAAKLSDRHAKWCTVQAAKALDQSKFNPDFD